MDAINVSVRPDGNYQVGNETLNPDQFNAKLGELKAAGFAGNFKVGDALSMDLAGVTNLFSSGPLKSAALTLAPPASSTGVEIDPGKLEKKMESFAQLMSDVFKLIAETASTERKSAREGRHAAQTAEQADLASQVDKLQDAASKGFEAALVQGIIGIATGVVTAAISVVSAGISIGGAGKALKDGVKGATEATATAAMKIADGIAQGIKAGGDAFSQVASTGGEMGAAGVRMEVDNLQAEAKQAESASRVDSAMAQDESEFMQNYADMQRDVRQKMQGIVDAQNATLNNLARA